jgi:hypothetical protein
MGLLPETLCDPLAGTLTIEVHRLGARRRYPRPVVALAPHKRAKLIRSAGAKKAGALATF